MPIVPNEPKSTTFSRLIRGSGSTNTFWPLKLPALATEPVTVKCAVLSIEGSSNTPNARASLPAVAARSLPSEPAERTVPLVKIPELGWVFPRLRTTQKIIFRSESPLNQVLHGFSERKMMWF